MKKTTEQLLNEELGRFMSINKYIGSVNEQEEGGEEEMALPAPTDDTEELPTDDVEVAGTEDEVESTETDDTEVEDGGFSGMDMDDEGTEELPTEELPVEGDETEEVDVTDLVDGQKELEEKFQDTEEKIQQSIEKVDSVFGKLDDFESKLGELDKLYQAVNDLGHKIDQAKPKTPEEKLELRSLDSYPYNQKLTDFFDDKETEMEVSGKNEYVLTTDDVKNMSDKDVKDSFTPPSEEEEL